MNAAHRAANAAPPPAIAAPANVAPSCHSLPPEKDTRERPPTHRRRYRPWHELMHRYRRIHVETYGRCGGKMTLVELVEPTTVPRVLVGDAGRSVIAAAVEAPASDRLGGSQASSAAD